MDYRHRVTPIFKTGTLRTETNPSAAEPGTDVVFHKLLAVGGNAPFVIHFSEAASESVMDVGLFTPARKHN